MSWIEGEDYYLNEQGRVVLLEKYHMDRGYCCGNGCLHCPYHYDAVGEPYKTKLLNERKARAQESKD